MPVQNVLCKSYYYIYIFINHHITNSSPFLRSLMSLPSKQGALDNRGRIGLSRHKSLPKTLKIASTHRSVASQRLAKHFTALFECHHVNTDISKLTETVEGK